MVGNVITTHNLYMKTSGTCTISPLGPQGLPHGSNICTCIGRLGHYVVALASYRGKSHSKGHYDINRNTYIICDVMFVIREIPVIRDALTASMLWKVRKNWAQPKSQCGGNYGGVWVFLSQKKKNLFWEALHYIIE